MFWISSFAQLLSHEQLLYVSLYKEEVVLTHGPEHQLTTRHAMFSAGVKTKLLHATTLHIVSFDHTVLARAPCVVYR